MVFNSAYSTIVETVTLAVDTTGAAGSASGSAVTPVPVYGYLLDVFLDFHASAPSTTDTTLAYTAPANGTILAVANSNTDALIAPRQKLVDNANAAITNAYDRFPLNGTLTLSLAQCDALTAAVTARIRYLRVA
jgi:hypothetical protein